MDDNETQSEAIVRLTIQIAELNDELNTRCTEIVNLKDEISKLSNRSFEYGKMVGYADGYEKGWQAALSNTEWNIE